LTFINSILKGHYHKKSIKAFVRHLMISSLILTGKEKKYPKI
jgi:hypothetical protein